MFNDACNYQELDFQMTSANLFHRCVPAAERGRQ